MEPTFRWYGPKDPVPLNFIPQAGATGVVTSLHYIPYGDLWMPDAIMERKKMVEDAGLTWSVVESLPIHEDIKTASGSYKRYLDIYKQSIRNLGQCGIKTITYNFMPVLDWIRTDLQHELPDGSKVLYFNQIEFAVFEMFILRRQGAEKDYSAETIAKAEDMYNNMSDHQRFVLTRSIIDNFPGFKGVTLEDIRNMLAKYENFSTERLRENLAAFLTEVVPVAEEWGCRMVIHPDDPPRSILGLPRIFSTLDDIKSLLAISDSPANGVASVPEVSAPARITMWWKCSRHELTESYFCTCAVRRCRTAISLRLRTLKAESICMNWSKLSVMNRFAVKPKAEKTGGFRSVPTTVRTLGMTW